jgi:hypothetical protein
MSASRSFGRTRIELLLIRTCGSSPFSHLVDRPSTDGKQLGHLGHPQQPVAPAPEELQVGESGRRAAHRRRLRRALGLRPHPGPPCAAVALELGRKRVEKFLGNAPTPCEWLESTPPSVCKDCAGLSSVGSPCDGPGPDSGPKGRRFKSSRPDNIVRNPGRFLQPPATFHSTLCLVLVVRDFL